MADTFKVEQINGVSKLRPMVFSVLFGNKEEKNILEDEHRTTKCSKKVRYTKTKNTQITKKWHLEIVIKIYWLYSNNSKKYTEKLKVI